MIRIFLIGYMGSGKTTTGKILAEKLGCTFVDMDLHIEQKYHKTVSQIFEEQGQEKFRLLEQQCLHEVAQFENAVIATGGGAPCFFDNMDYMNAHGATVYLKLTPEQLCNRLESSRAGKRPLLAERKGEALRLFIAEGLALREPFYSRAQFTVDSDDAQVVAKICNLVTAL